MKSGEYRDIIRIIVRRAIGQALPELKKGKDTLADLIAKNVHARMYGANVDGVDSPLWRSEDSKQPDVDASKLLEEPQ